MIRNFGYRNCKLALICVLSHCKLVVIGLSCGIQANHTFVYLVYDH